MTSDAVLDPPGLSMRSTMARTEESARADRIASIRVFGPAPFPIDRTEAAGAAGNDAGDVDHGNARAAREARLPEARPAVILSFHFRIPALRAQVVELVLIGQRVHEAGPQRGVREK